MNAMPWRSPDLPAGGEGQPWRRPRSFLGLPFGTRLPLFPQTLLPTLSCWDIPELWGMLFFRKTRMCLWM